VATLNVETGRNEEALILKYWSDFIPHEEGIKLADSVARVLESFVSGEPGQETLRDRVLLQANYPGLSNPLPSWMVQNNVESPTGQPPITMSPSPLSETPPGSDVQTRRKGESMAAHISRTGRSAHLENKLLDLWSSMLKIDRETISVGDSFFELGGDSLGAMKLVGAAREEGLALTVADVFRNPIFEDMATVLRVASMINIYLEDDDQAYGSHGRIAHSAAAQGVYQRFSLVKATDINAFLQNTIIPNVGVFKGGISDVLPASDFQALAVTGSLLKSRWMLNYFFLDGKGAPDNRRLKLSCLRLMQSADIIRTVFLPCAEGFLQVILRKLRPELSFYETDLDLNEFTAMLHRSDQEQGPRLGEPFASFAVVKQNGTDRHRILIRLSHAQYDGICISTILRALEAGYNDEPLPKMSSFASYVRASAATVTSDHYQHWKALLKGSRMTPIVNRNGPNYRISSEPTSVLKQTILLPPIAHGSITTATVVKAAWATVLARLSASSDVVFGNIISGRNPNIPKIESTVGPCLNMVPVRTRLEDNWTALDLFRHVQSQQIANMPYEALGFREIIRHCTEWADWTNFTTTVQHQSTGYDNELQLGDDVWKVGAYGVSADFADFSVVSTPLGSYKCEIALEFLPSGEITPLFAQKVLHMLCDTVVKFVADPTTPLPSPNQLLSLQPQIIEEAAKPSDNFYLNSQLEGLDRAELLVLSETLIRVWRKVLGEDDTPNLHFESSFFDLNGDIMGLAQVSWLLEQEGFPVLIEDLIEHPTVLGHVAAMWSSNTKSETSGSPASPVDDEDQSKQTLKWTLSNPWVRTLSLARRMVRRNTRGA
jgi:acyl carrier protein